ncbi:alcohol dehydrogenase-like 5 [Macadamia integrifolia]|uniref:alcohol dehydrogenase-like 5 n=1 Tax=Macadamia integrifolia TaxID=60698 RepID=UPI001C4E5C62|nr:alcohol dehydrogenase-like 5 [Macadamia integrifolia]
MRLLGVGAAWKTANVEAGTSVAIFGLGAIGLAEIGFDEFGTQEVQFEDINKAFDLLISGKSNSCIIWMDKQTPPPM